MSPALEVRNLNHWTTREVSKVLCLLYLFLKNYLCIYFYLLLRWVFVAVRGLFSSCGERGLLFVAVRGLLIVVASLVAEHGL